MHLPQLLDDTVTHAGLPLDSGFVTPIPVTAAPPVRRNSNSWTSSLNSALWKVFAPWTAAAGDLAGSSRLSPSSSLSSIAGVRRLNPPSAMALRRRRRAK